MVQHIKLYRSGEITHFTGISRQTLHYYVQIGLIEEAKRTRSGQRLYDESIFKVISKIKRYKEQNMSLIKIREKLKEDRQVKFPFMK